METLSNCRHAVRYNKMFPATNPLDTVPLLTANRFHQGATVDTDKVEYASAEELKEEEEDEHIYETAEPLPEPGVRLRAATTLERNAVKEDLGEVEVGGNLKGIVKDKVVEFETLARNSTLESNPRVACHVSADPDTCPQSLKQTNSGSKAPFRV